MNRGFHRGAKRLATSAVVAAVAAFAGACPIPQPLPGVGQIDAGVTITPPRVATASAQPVPAVTGYSTTCASGAQFVVSANVIDENTGEPIDVRWFADYDPTSQLHLVPVFEQTLPAPSDSTQVTRTPTPFIFEPGDFDTPAPHVHVLEMVISNGFEPVPDGGFLPTSDGGLPYREPAPGYEVQQYRWTFDPEADGGCGP